MSIIFIRKFFEKSRTHRDGRLRKSVISKTKLSGFAYSNLWEAEFPPHWTGTGNVTIALPEGYTTKKWTIQFRWPLQLRGMECFEDTLRQQDCGGDPTNSVDGQTCKNQHYHLTPHFYDQFETGEISRLVYSHWESGTEFDPDGPIPCIDWCDEGEVPEYPGPCIPPISPEKCQSNCYDAYFACVKACADNDTVCASECSRNHYECFNGCVEE